MKITNIKKNIFALTLALFAITALAQTASAATIIKFSSGNINYSSGSTFLLNVSLDPQGTANYTSKLEIDFPAGLLKVNSFTFGDGWTPISMSGYDLIDNTNGVLIKTAGYPGGTTNPLVFGTISFTTLKAGTGAITVNSNSSVLGASGQNLLDTTAISAPVNISAVATTTPTPTSASAVKPVVKPVTRTVTKPVVKTPTTSPAQTIVPQQTTEPTVAPVTPTQTAPAEPAGLLPGFMKSISLGNSTIWLLAVLLALAVIYVVYSVLKPSKEKQKR